MNNSIQQFAMTLNAALNKAVHEWSEHFKIPENVDRFVDQVRLAITAMILGWVVVTVCACCADPFGENLRRRLKIVESELSDAEDMISHLDDENEKLKSELAKARVEISEMESRYLSCRQAAQRFIDTPPDLPSGKRQRVDSK
jgi:septal ring factor EnvC (AmiA/AmiB activator)